MSKSPAKKSPPTDDQEQQEDNNTQNSFDWSSVLPPGRIKTQIQLEDDNIGCLPKKTLELISTCSALLLRKVVQTSCTAVAKKKKGKNKTKKKKDDSSDTIILLSAQDIQAGIQTKAPSTKCLKFLEDVVEQAVQDDDQKIAVRKPKRQRAAAKSNNNSTNTNTNDRDAPATKMAKLSNTSSASASASAGGIGGGILSQETLDQAVEMTSKEPGLQTTKIADTVVLDDEDYD